MGNSNIQLVADNMDKYVSYTKTMSRYKKAFNNGYYFECLWILYAMLEDRTSSFLYYIGFVSSKEKKKAPGSKKIKNQIKLIISFNNRYNFDSISGKINRIKEILCWHQSNNPNGEYQEQLYLKLKTLDIDGLLKGLEYLDIWRDKRNQLIHALFNKNSNAVDVEISALVIDGYTAIRIIDQSVKMLKKGVDLRKKFNIQ